MSVGINSLCLCFDDVTRLFGVHIDVWNGKGKKGKSMIAFIFGQGPLSIIFIWSRELKG